MNLFGKRQQFIWTNDHLLPTNSRRGGLCERPCHLGLPLCECGEHVIPRDLANAVVILRSEPRNGDIQESPPREKARPCFRESPLHPESEPSATVTNDSGLSRKSSA